MPNFANIEQRVNQKVNKTLANVTADFGNGLEVEGIFNGPYTGVDIGNIGFDSTMPTFTFLKEAAPDYEEVTSIVINNVTYKIHSPEPDGTGFITLNLQK